MVYLDNIIIFSKNEVEHLKHIEIIFKKLKEVGLKLKESKCDFFKWEIHYLGHLISVDRIQPLPEKLDSICDMPKPRSPKEIKQLLGLTGYYRKFVPQLCDMARPWTKLLAHDCEFIWDKQCDILFQMLHQYWSTLIQQSHTHCIQMQASMDGQEYSQRGIHPLQMEKKSL